MTVSASLDPRRSRFDGYLLLATVYLLTFGLMTLYSKSATLDHGGIFRKQVLNTVVGLVPFGIMLIVPPKFWERNARWVYGVNMFLLLLVRVLGKSVNGAARWIDIGPLQFQPSELAKLLVILTLASFLASRQDEIERPTTFALSFLHVLAPMALIILQPHLGATMVVFVTWFAVALVGKVPGRFLAIAAGGVVLLAGLVLTVPAVAGHFLHGYQKDRITGLQSEQKDVRGRNWQTDRAEIAFGVGGVYGTGYLKGQQKELGFIPEQQTDFIFSVLGEEGGLIGCTLLLAGYAFFFYRVWLIMLNAEDPFYRMVSGGIFTVLLFHAFVNMAMVLQLLPVVGLWLPFMSYGGTAVWLCMACVGLLLNIRRRERQILF
jgi:rod shape determining protein RodA